MNSDFIKQQKVKGINLNRIDQSLQKQNLMNFSVKDIVWAKVKGYPWWPAQIAKLADPKTHHVKKHCTHIFNMSALLDQQCIKNYSQNYQEYSKRKTKKLTQAIQTADESLKKRAQLQKKQKGRKMKKRKSGEEGEQSKSVQDAQSVDEKKKQETPFQSQQLSYSALVERENEICVNRNKIQKVQSQLQQIILELECERRKEWKHSKYFQGYKTDFLNCEELVQSNLTKMLKYIIVKMEQHNMETMYIERVMEVAEQLKDRIMKYLTNTLYYDQFLKIMEKNKQNRTQIEGQIIKITKKQSHNKVKKEFLTLFANLIGNQISNNNFQYEPFLVDLKDKKYEVSQELTSKAGTIRFVDTLARIYQ